MSDRRRTEERRERRGWTCVAAMTAVVVATWITRLTSPLPGNHIGNVAARYGLHVRNLFADGLVGSSFSAAWEPYRTEPYAHHPPLLNLLDAIVGLVPGEATFQVLLVPVVLAASALPAAAWLLRTLGFGWRATLLAVAAMAATAYFWVYSHVMVDLGPILALTASVVLLIDGSTNRRLVAAVSALVAVNALLSWPGIAFTVALVGWLVVRRTESAWRVGTVALVSIGASLAFMVGVSGRAELLDQTDQRRSSGSYPVGTVARYALDDARDLLPLWYLVLTPLLVGFGIADRRSRWLMALFTAAAAAWTLVLGNGTVVHDYWAYLLLLPGLLGCAALADRALVALDGGEPPRGSRPRRGDWWAGLAGVGIAVTFAMMVAGPLGDRLIDRPTDAGHLIEAMDMPADQRVAWIVGFDFFRVISYRLDRPVDAITDVDLDGIGDDEVVFVDLEALPDWYPERTMPEPVAERNGYAVVTVGHIRAALADDPTGP